MKYLALAILLVGCSVERIKIGPRDTKEEELVGAINQLNARLQALEQPAKKEGEGGRGEN